MPSSYNYLGIELMATGENAGTWGDKTNTNLDIIQQAASGYHSQSLNLVGTGANTTALDVALGDATSVTDALTNAARNAVIKLTGAITGNKIVTVPNTVNSIAFERLFLFENATTGSFTVEIRTASGATQTGCTFGATEKIKKLVFSDGTQVYDTGFAAPAAATTPGGSDTEIQFNNSSAFGGSANFTWDDTNVLIDAEGALRLGDAAGNAYVGLQAPTTITSDTAYTLKLPVATGQADEVIKTDGAGNLSWTAVAGGTSWQAVKTTGFTAVAGEGYPCNTTGGGFTMTLPTSPSAGDTIEFVDYLKTFNTQNLTIGRAGENINNVAANAICDQQRMAGRLVYIDSTAGWRLASSANASADNNTGSFNLTAPTYAGDFLIIAGGGAGGGSNGAGGGGAGGYRNSYASEASGGGGSTETDVTLSAGTVYTITVGGGGTNDGVDSSITALAPTLQTVSVAGGGGGAQDGGCGGGANNGGGSGGQGTTNQGYDGGSSGTGMGGGGGGAGVIGTNGAHHGNAGPGGDGLTSSINGTPTARAGGGGGGTHIQSNNGNGGSGGGGGGSGGPGASGAQAGTINTGSGGGGAQHGGGNGGSGVVFLRVPTADYTSTVTGSPQVGTSGTDTIMTFTGSGSYTG